MQRKTSATPTRVYVYGCLPPTEGADAYNEQLRAANRYYNRLVEIERARRVAINEARAKIPGVKPLQDAVDALLVALEAARTAIKAKRLLDHRVDLTVEKAQVEALRAELGEAKRARAEVTKRLKEDPEMQAAYKTADSAAHEEVRKARATCGVYWGTYLRVEDSVQQASKKPPPDGHPWHEWPRFRRFDGEGLCAVQIQGGMPAAEVFGDDTRLRLDAIPDDTYRRPRSARERASRSVVHLRVGSNGRAPIWASFPCTLHRPLPHDAVIKWAWVQRRRIGIDARYELCIAVESETFHPRCPAGEGRVAVNLGWRNKLNGQIRVGYWLDDAGRHGEIIVPQRVVDRLQHARSITSIHDRSFDEIRTAFSAWLAEQGESVPQWLREQTEHIGKWRSAGRLVMVLRAWQPFNGDAEIRAKLEAWAKNDRHLVRWAAHQTSRTLGHRREVYRIIAAQMARKYATVLVDDMDLTDMTQGPTPEEGPRSQGHTQRATAQLASPGSLRDALKLACSNTGAAFVTRHGDTQTCARCKSTSPWNARWEIEHTCVSCGERWDQDYNHCENMLRESRERGGGEVVHAERSQSDSA